MADFQMIKRILPDIRFRFHLFFHCQCHKENKTFNVNKKWHSKLLNKIFVFIFLILFAPQNGNVCVLYYTYIEKVSVYSLNVQRILK